MRVGGESWLHPDEPLPLEAISPSFGFAGRDDLEYVAVPPVKKMPRAVSPPPTQYGHQLVAQRLDKEDRILTIKRPGGRGTVTLTSAPVQRLDVFPSDFRPTKGLVHSYASGRTYFHSTDVEVPPAGVLSREHRSGGAAHYPPSPAQRGDRDFPSSRIPDEFYDSRDPAFYAQHPEGSVGWDDGALHVSHVEDAGPIEPDYPPHLPDRDADLLREREQLGQQVGEEWERAGRGYNFGEQGTGGRPKTARGRSASGSEKSSPRERVGEIVRVEHPGPEGGTLLVLDNTGGGMIAASSRDEEDIEARQAVLAAREEVRRWEEEEARRRAEEEARLRELDAALGIEVSAGSAGSRPGSPPGSRPGSRDRQHLVQESASSVPRENRDTSDLPNRELLVLGDGAEDQEQYVAEYDEEGFDEWDEEDEEEADALALLMGGPVKKKKKKGDADGRPSSRTGEGESDALGGGEGTSASGGFLLGALPALPGQSSRELGGGERSLGLDAGGFGERELGGAAPDPLLQPPDSLPRGGNKTAGEYYDDPVMMPAAGTPRDEFGTAAQFDQQDDSKDALDALGLLPSIAPPAGATLGEEEHLSTVEQPSSLGAAPALAPLPLHNLLGELPEIPSSRSGMSSSAPLSGFNQPTFGGGRSGGPSGAGESSVREKKSSSSRSGKSKSPRSDKQRTPRSDKEEWGSAAPVPSVALEQGGAGVEQKPVVDHVGVLEEGSAPEISSGSPSGPSSARDHDVAPAAGGFDDWGNAQNGQWSPPAGNTPREEDAAVPDESDPFSWSGVQEPEQERPAAPPVLGDTTFVDWSGAGSSPQVAPAEPELPPANVPFDSAVPPREELEIMDPFEQTQQVDHPRPPDDPDPFGDLDPFSAAMPAMASASTREQDPFDWSAPPAPTAPAPATPHDGLFGDIPPSPTQQPREEPQGLDYMDSLLQQNMGGSPGEDHLGGGAGSLSASREDSNRQVVDNLLGLGMSDGSDEDSEDDFVF